MKKIIVRLSNNQRVDLSKLSIEELYKLHFDEEKYTATELKKMSPFSKERIDLLKKCYDILEPIKEYRNYLEEKNNVKRVNKSVHKEFLYNIFIKVLSKINKKNLTVLELGCGNCVFLNKISNIDNLNIYGCDLHPNNCNNINVFKESLYDTLNRFEDNSIDVLVADNVCKHFFEDEADVIYDLIYNKLSKTGKVIFLIPNIYVGPSDVSKYFLKEGMHPVGFHFMEQTYKENIALFNKHKLYTDYIVLRYDFTPIFIKNIFFLDKIKVFFEKILGNLNMSLKYKKIMFDRLGYLVYILKRGD